MYRSYSQSYIVHTIKIPKRMRIWKKYGYYWQSSWKSELHSIFKPSTRSVYHQLENILWMGKCLPTLTINLCAQGQMLEINSYDQINYFRSNLGPLGVKLSECIVVIRNNLNNTSIAYIDIVFIWKSKKNPNFQFIPKYWYTLTKISLFSNRRFSLLAAAFVVLPWEANLIASILNKC